MIHYLATSYWNKGIKREQNEDSALIHSYVTRKGPVLLAAVCDGVGGLREGQTASGYVCERLSDWFYQDLPNMIARPDFRRRMSASLNRLVSDVHETLMEYGQRKKIALGSTLTLILLYQKKYYLFHIGDSAAFFRRRRSFCKLTKEQRAVSGKLLQCIGCGRHPKGVLTVGKCKVRSSFLLCTDGYAGKLNQEILEKMFPNQKLLPITKINLTLERFGERCMKDGEEDNLTALYITIEK